MNDLVSSITLTISSLIALYLFKIIIVDRLRYVRKFRKFPQDRGNFIFGNIFQTNPIFVFGNQSLAPSNGNSKNKTPSFVMQVSGKKVFQYLTDKFHDHGFYIFWSFWRPWLHVIGHKHVQTVLSSKKNMDKTDFLKFNKPLFKDGLFLSTEKKWKTRRRMIEPPFGPQVLTDFIPTVKQNVDKFVSSLEDLTGAWIQLEEPISMTALSIVCETSMGLSADSDVTEDQIGRFVRTMRLWILLFTYRAMNPLLWPDWVFTIYMRLRYPKELKLASSLCKSIAERKIAERMKELEEEKSPGINGKPSGTIKRRKVFIDHLVDIHIDGVSKGTPTIDLEGIDEEVNIFIFAGFDSVGTSMHWTLYLLGLNRGIQEKIYQEIQQIDLNDEAVTIHDLNKLTYLEQVIKEGLRMFPPAAITLRTIEDESLELDGHQVPKGVPALISIWSVHHDPDIYPEPYKFDPDRFSPERAQSIPTSAFLPFGTGPRICVGQRFAYLEMKIFLIEVIRKYRVICDKPIDLIDWHVPIILKPNEPMFFKLIPRDL